MFWNKTFDTKKKENWHKSVLILIVNLKSKALVLGCKFDLAIVCA